MKNKKGLQIISILAILAFIGFLVLPPLLNNSSKPKSAKPPVRAKKKRIQAPTFNADSAYSFIQKQVDFGPRVPNSKGSKQCGDWLVEKLRTYSDNVIEQKDKVTAYNGESLNMRNIIAEFQPENDRRIMLYAHWDTRPYADKDSVNMESPIDGANDGGSGVGVLLEIARILKDNPTDYGIDIILFDTEDYGSPEGIKGDSFDWCLGSQYWGKNPHRANYSAKYGILLDMVGGKNAQFPHEGTSLAYAEHVVNKLWNSAERLGHSDLFVEKESGRTTDDHLFVNEYRNIPSAAIVEFHVNAMGMFGAYGKFHHTHRDNMDVISTNTLQKVGEVVLDVIYNE